MLVFNSLYKLLLYKLSNGKAIFVYLSRNFDLLS